MSDLLNQASLVMAPSGYKEDTVYSVVPSDGSGDLSFTRASNGTRINSAGLVEVCPWNLLEYSEDLSNAIWGNDAGNTKISNTTTAPNGTVTADTISAISGNVMNVYQIIQTNDGTLSYSVYLKKNATNLISIYIYQTFGSTGFKALGEINFDNGTFTASVGTGTIESVGNGWFRLTLTATLLSGANSFGIYTTSDTGTRNVYLWGAQLNIGATAKPYFPTTDRLNVPRLTYQNGGGGCPSLLLEKQSTNVAYPSQAISGYTKSSDVTLTDNNAISPDGTQNATYYFCNTTTTNGYLLPNFSGTSGVQYAVSFYAKAKELSLIYIKNVNDTGGQGIFNLSNGTYTIVSGIDSMSIVDVGNGWYRCTAISTSSTASIAFIPIIKGSTNQGVYIWGVQIEQSSYPTSYIPTTSSSATRVADDYSRSLSSIASGTAYINITDNVAVGTPGTHLFGPFSITGASLGLYLSRPNNARLRLWTQASANVFQTTETNLKLAMTWDGTNVNVYQNGVKVVTNYAYAITNVNNLFASTYLESSATIPEIVLFNSVLTDAECIALTT